MPFIIRCVKCKRKLRVLDRLLGKLVKCPGCQTKFVATTGGPSPLTTAPASGKASSSSGRLPAPKSQPPSRASVSRPLPRTPPPSKAPPSRPALAAASARRIQPPPPPEDLTVEQGEEEFMRAPDPMMPRPGPQLDGLERTTPKPGARRPPQSSFLSVFVTLGGILLLTAILGMVSAWWVNSSVQSLQGRGDKLR